MSKRRKRRTWSDDEKREICQQTVAPGVSVAQVARRYALNANMIHTWLKDPRFAATELEPEGGFDTSDFIEVAVTAPELPVVADAGGANFAGGLSATRVDIVLSDGRRILIEGPTSLMAVIGLVQGLTV
jgi:transposase